MEDDITTALRSNSTDGNSSHPIWYFMLLFALMQLFFFLFCLFMVIYLSIRLKKRAWDSPAKRFGNILNVFISLTFLAFAIYNVCVVPRETDTYPILLPLLISISFSHLCFLYFIAICVSLLLQIVSPFFNEQLKQCTRKTHCAIFTEVVCHILLPVLFIALTTFIGGFNFESSLQLILLIVIELFLIPFVLFCSSFLMFALVALIKFFRNQNIALSNKYMITKLVSILIVYIACNIASVIILTENYSFWLIIYFLNVDMVLYFIFSILVVSLNHPIRWCGRRSPVRAPLLPVNNTERQQTNPISVRDHRNVPSCTVTNLPYDMSDCRSNYVI